MYEPIPGACFDCAHNETGFCGHYDDNDVCARQKDDGTCWKPDYEGGDEDV